MAIQVSLKVDPISKGLWSAMVPVDDLRRLGKPLAAVGNRIVLGVVNPRVIDDNLYCPLEDVTVLNGGQNTEAIIVELTAKSEAAPAPHSKPTADGDEAFLAQCRALLPKPVVTLAEHLMAAVRQEYEGQMCEGKARKWVNYPSNFLAIVIQTRLGMLAVSVKGSPAVHRGAPFDIKDGMRGYSEFKLSKPADLQAALTIIRRSASL